MSITSESIKTLRGGMRFLNDMTFPRIIESRVITSEIPKGRFNVASVPDLPPGYYCLLAADIPGKNSITPEGIPLLAESEILYRDQPIAVMAGEDPEVLIDLAEKLAINYMSEPAVLDPDPENPAVRHETMTYTHGDVGAALKKSHQVLDGEYTVNMQEYQFLEPQSAVALWEKKILTVYCPTKNPFHVRDVICGLLSIPPERVCVVVPDSVQDPGEKETLPMVIASFAALITFRSGKTVRVTLENSLKQYPAIIHYTTGLSKGKNITGMRARLFIDTGAFPLPSPNLFHRAVYCLPGAYHHNTTEIDAHALSTNKVPYTRSINGGAFESFFAVELHFSRLARAAGTDPITFRKNNLFHASPRATREQKQLSLINQILADVGRRSDFIRRYAAYEALRGPQEKAFDGSVPVRGIGCALTYFGFDFLDETETQERHSVKLILEKDNTLRMMTSVLEMGPGLKHLVTAIAVNVLEIDPDDVVIETMDTLRVPNSGPMYETHAVTVIGKLIEQACLLLKRKRDKEKRPITVIRTDSPRTKRTDQTGKLFQHIDAPSFPWCATVIETEIDPASFRVSVPGIWITIETGVILNKDIARAHVEKEVMSALEFVEYSPFVHQHKMRPSFTLPPLAISFIESPYPQGPLGAKGIGELPSLGIAPAYVAAVSQASGFDFTSFPLSPMQIEKKVEGK